LMRFNPAAKYTTGDSNQPLPRDALSLLSVPPNAADGLVPVRVPPDDLSSLSFLGKASYLPVFAFGNAIEKQHPELPRYILLQATWRTDPATGALIAPESITCCGSLRPSVELEFRYDLSSKTTGRHLNSSWLSIAQPLIPPPGPATERFDRLTIDTRNARRAGVAMRTAYDISSGVFTIGNQEAAISGSAQDVRLDIRMPALTPEVCDYNGRRYNVNWLPKQTKFSVVNPGRRTQAVLELILGVLEKPHAAVLSAGGKALSQRVSIKKVFWVNGAETIRYPVTLQPGENQFLLESTDPPEKLSDGRQVCFLLIEGIKVIAQ